jgi:hypothetical protein
VPPAAKADTRAGVESGLIDRVGRQDQFAEAERGRGKLVVTMVNASTADEVEINRTFLMDGDAQ